MPDIDKILAIKKAAQWRLFALPGVHSIGVGPKITAGQPTNELAIIVYLLNKKPLAELSAAEIIPAEINGVKTDVVQEERPVPHASLPDAERYDVLEGGIQIQAGSTVTGLGTLGCIAKTRDDPPKILALTCHHVVALWGEKRGTLKVWTSPNGQQVIFYDASSGGLLITLIITLVPTGPGNVTTLPWVLYNTTPADTLTTVAANVAAGINALANPSLSATSAVVDSGAQVTLTPAAGFQLKTNCRISAMWATIDLSQTRMTFAGQNVTGSVVVVNLAVTTAGASSATNLDIIYQTIATDTLASIAGHISSDINALANPALTATQSGAQVTVIPGAGASVATDVMVYNPRVDDPDSRLQASVAGGTILLSGKVADEHYGIYTFVNTGGDRASSGGFVAVPENAELTPVAASVSAAINGLSLPGVNAVPTGPQVAVTVAEAVDCEVASDVRVGQPDNSFSSKCSPCCNHRIGRVIAARLEVDVALIQLDPKLKYKGEIAEIGWVTGVHDVTASEILPPDSYRYGSGAEPLA